MRLWHYKLLPYLPKSQLLAQKRECDLIWKDLENDKKTNHILINYVWEYEDYLKELSVYYWLLKEEFDKRGFKFNFSKNFITKNEFYGYNYKPFTLHHNNSYMLVCYFNLFEKYKRGQKDFSDTIYNNLYDFVNNELKGLLDNINDNYL